MPRSRDNNQNPNLYPTTNIDNLRGVQDIYDRINFMTQELQALKSSLPSMVSPYARKESPISGILNIPSTDTDSPQGMVRISDDGVIVSYINPIISAYPLNKKLFSGEAGPNVSGTGEVTVLPGLATFDGTLTIDPAITRKIARVFDLWCFGRVNVGAVTNALTIRLKFGGTTFVTITGNVIALANGQIVFHCPLFVRTPGGTTGVVGINNATFMYPVNLVASYFGTSAANAINWESGGPLGMSFEWTNNGSSLDFDGAYCNIF